MSETRTDPDDLRLDEGLRGLIGYAMKRATTLVTADAARVLDAHGLRITTFSALSVICDSPGVTQTQLAAALAIERSNSVALIDALEQAGLIERQRSEADRRAIALCPTARGQRLQARARAALDAHEARMFAALSEAERRQLVALLSRIVP